MNKLNNLVSNNKIVIPAILLVVSILIYAHIRKLISSMITMMGVTIGIIAIAGLYLYGKKHNSKNKKMIKQKDKKTKAKKEEHKPSKEMHSTEIPIYKGKED